MDTDPTEPFETTPPEPSGAPLPPGPGGAFSPVPQPVTPGPDRRAGRGTIVATALLSAVLASGGTVAVLEGTGALHPAAAPTAAPASSNLGNGSVVRIDESSAVVDAAAKVSPAVVRITATGVTTDPLGGTIPSQGVGSGIIFDAAGWILTNRHVVQIDTTTIASKLTVELKDGHQYTGTVYG